MYWFLRNHNLRRIHHQNNHKLSAGELLLEGCEPSDIADGDWQRVGPLHPLPAEGWQDEGVVRGLTGPSNLIQKCIPISVLPKVKRAKLETCLLHKFLLMVGNMQPVLLHNLNGAFSCEALVALARSRF